MEGAGEAAWTSASCFCVPLSAQSAPGKKVAAINAAVALRTTIEIGFVTWILLGL